MRRVPKWTLFCAGLLIGGGLVAAGGIADVLDGIQSRSWTATDGTITLSKMESGTARRRRSFRRRTYYSPQIQYRYRAGDRELLGERISADNVRFLGMKTIDSSRTDAAEVEQIVSRYPVGSTARVYYDPDDPTRALLEPGTTSGAMLRAAAGSLLFLGGVVLLIYKLRRR